MNNHPLLFLDFDDVICLNKPYGGYDVKIFANVDPPKDFYEKLFDQKAKEILLSILNEFNPRVVITTSWLKFMNRDSFVTLFKKTGLEQVADSLHEQWDAPQLHQSNRLDAISQWLQKFHENDEPFIILDDKESGSKLRGSKFDTAGQLILCDLDIGLKPHHLETIRASFTKSR
jgi:hypothetical protein